MRNPNPYPTDRRDHGVTDQAHVARVSYATQSGARAGGMTIDVNIRDYSTAYRAVFTYDLSTNRRIQILLSIHEYCDREE